MRCKFREECVKKSVVMVWGCIVRSSTHEGSRSYTSPLCAGVVWRIRAEVAGTYQSSEKFREWTMSFSGWESTTDLQEKCEKHKRCRLGSKAAMDRHCEPDVKSPVGLHCRKTRFPPGMEVSYSGISSMWPSESTAGYSQAGFEVQRNQEIFK